MMAKIVGIDTKRIELDNYEECLSEHLAHLSEEEKTAKPTTLVIGCACDDGSFRYSILAGSDPLAIIGAVETIKQSMFYELM